MDVTVMKILIFVLGFVKLLSGIAPLVIINVLGKKGGRFLNKFIGSVLCFGGGVLLSTVMLHMWREVGENLEKASGLGMYPEKEHYPFSELIIGLGFLIILVIESGVHKFHASLSVFESQEKLSDESQSLNRTINASDNQDQECCKTIDNCPAATKENEKKEEQKMLSSLRGYLVVIALSVHGVCEGIAIGLEESEAGVLKLLMAVSIHAAPIVFCVSTNMISSGIKKLKVFIFMIILSINTPGGVIIGLIISFELSELSALYFLIISILQGLAAGTLLYITFFEVLARDKLDKYGMSGLLGALAIILGFSLMAALEISHCGVPRVRDQLKD